MREYSMLTIGQLEVIAEHAKPDNVYPEGSQQQEAFSTIFWETVEIHHGYSMNGIDPHRKATEEECIDEAIRLIKDQIGKDEP